jgi:hypothetical protein
MPRLLAILLLLTACTPAAEMKPGQPCGSCHGDHALAFTAAGTLYDHGDGLEGARIDLVDARGRTVTLRSNRSGNFFTREPLAPPLQVAVTSGAARMAMHDAPHGDCNGCHAGDTGPGPIHLP